MFRTCTPLAVLLLALPLSAPAQEAGGVRLTPTLGWLAPLNDLGTVRQGEATMRISVESSVAAGLALEWSSARLPVGLRGQLAYAPGAGLASRTLSGQTSCGENCVKFLYDRNDIADGSALLLVGDAMVRPGRFLGVLPYAAAGVGIKRYSFGQPAPGTGLSEVFGDEPARMTLHLAAGLEFDLGPVQVSTELGDYISRYAFPEGSPGTSIGNLRQHDVAATVGIRVRAP